MGFVPLEEEEIRARFLWCVRVQQDLAEGPHRNQACKRFDLGFPSFQNCEKNIFCCLSRPVRYFVGVTCPETLVLPFLPGTLTFVLSQDLPLDFSLSTFTPPF